MITNTGKNIIAKYLVGQTPIYASYMSMGCGSTPLLSTTSQPNYSDQASMDFEMFRVPITSRGYVKESVTADITDASYSSGTITYIANNSFIPGDRITISGITPTTYNLVDQIVQTATNTQFTIEYTGSFASYSSGGLAIATRSRIVLTAELPTEQRYQISEIGIYSAKSNPSAINRDSRMLYSFVENENWEYHNSSTSGSLGNTITVPLYGGSNDGIIKPTDPLVDATYSTAFRASTDNAIFNSISRIEKYENCRFLNGIVMLAGNLSTLEEVGGKVDVKDRSTAYATNGTHIHLQGTNLNLSRQSSEDELRLAFSVVNKSASETTLHPSRVLIMVEFSSQDSAAPTNYAKFEIDSDTISGFSPATNRYYIATKKISELTKGPDFTWNSVSIVKIYASVFKLVDGVDTLTDDFYVALDAMRLENVTTQNPLYGLVGYAVARTSDAQPILKSSNTSNSVEFRYGLDVI
jgi:hypothetical protein